MASSPQGALCPYGFASLCKIIEATVKPAGGQLLATVLATVLDPRPLSRVAAGDCPFTSGLLRCGALASTERNPSPNNGLGQLKQWPARMSGGIRRSRYETLFTQSRRHFSRSETENHSSRRPPSAPGVYLENGYGRRARRAGARFYTGPNWTRPHDTAVGRGFSEKRETIL